MLQHIKQMCNYCANVIHGPQKLTQQAVYKAYLLISATKFYATSTYCVMFLLQCCFVQTWWALHMRSRSCLWRNFVTISGPNVNETPRSFSPHPIVSLSGSAQSRSHSSPEGVDDDRMQGWWLQTHLDQEHPLVS